MAATKRASAAGRTPSPWPEEQLLVTSDNPQVIKHGVLETGPFLGDFSIEASIDRGFSIATFDYRRVIVFYGQ